jgi:hypothetical protein
MMAIARIACSLTLASPVWAARSSFVPSAHGLNGSATYLRIKILQSRQNPLRRGRRQGTDRAQGTDRLAAYSAVFVRCHLFEIWPRSRGCPIHLAERLG